MQEEGLDRLDEISQGATPPDEGGLPPRRPRGSTARNDDGSRDATATGKTDTGGSYTGKSDLGGTEGGVVPSDMSSAPWPAMPRTSILEPRTILTATAAGNGPRAVPDDPPTHPPSAVLSLKHAMRRARADDAERASVIADLRAARIGRLEVLLAALKPVLAQIPEDVDCFDVGLMPGSNPRLFIDMIGFIEMGREPRVYSFIQDTRFGRIKLAESESVDTIVEAVTHYIARRLLERDKAIAAEAAQYPTPFEDRPPPEQGRRDGAVQALARDDETRSGPAVARRPIDERRARPRRGRVLLSWLGVAFAFLIDVLGSITFFTIIAFAAYFAWSSLQR